MANKSTGKNAASTAARVLGSSSSLAIQRSLAGSVLSQTGNSRITGIAMEAKASNAFTPVGNPAWSMKWLTVEDVIQRINSGTDTFYVADWAGNKAMIGVVNPGPGRRPSIRTYANGKWTDNLLALDQCRLY